MRLRELRKEKQLLQREVAAAIGVSAQSYGYYEKGINKPDPDTLIRLANFFECSIDYLLGRADDFGAVTVVASSSSGEALSKNARELLAIFRGLDEELQHRALAYMRRLGDTISDETAILQNRRTK